MGRAERGLLLLLLLLLLAQLPEQLAGSRARQGSDTDRRLRLALMRVRRCEGFGLGPLFIALAFYGGAGFVLGGREGRGVCFSRAPDATTRTS